MRPYSYIKEEAEAIIKNATPRYLIFGFKPDGIRGIPATYNLVIDMATDEEEVYDKIAGLETGFKIFSVGLEPMTSADWAKAVAASGQSWRGNR